MESFMERINEFFENHKRTGFFLILVLSAVMTTLFVLRSELRFTTYPNFSDPIDHHKYIYMAQHPLQFFIAPFCWRIGLPLLAGALPFDLQTNFLTLSFLAIVFSGVLLFYLLHRLGFTYFYSLLGPLLFFAAGWIVRMPIINFWVPNASVFFVILCLIFLLVTKKDVGFMVLLACGVCVKESAIFVAPLYYTFNCKKVIDWRAAYRTILLTLPAIIVLLLLRFVLLPAQNDNQQYVNSLPFILTQVQQGSVEYNYLSLLQTVALSRLQNLNLRELADLWFYPFGVLLTVLPFFAIRRSLAWLGKFWPFLILVYSQLLFAVSKIGLLYLALPVLVIMAVSGLEGLNRRWRVPSLFILLLPILTFGLNLTKIDDNADFKWLALVLLIWLGIVFILGKTSWKRASLNHPESETDNK